MAVSSFQKEITNKYCYMPLFNFGYLIKLAEKSHFLVF